MDEPLELVPLDITLLEKKLRIEMRMSVETMAQLIELPADHQDVFAWQHSDMQDIDRDIIEHCLSFRTGAQKFRQKRRSFSTEKYVVIVEEVHQLLAAGFIREAQYPKWLSKVVLV